jgi:uncharacterized protein (TIGR02001 family)
MFDLPPPDPGIEVVVASRGMSKGIAQTEGPQLVAKSFVQFGALQVGGQWKNVSSSVARGEAAAYISATHKVEQFQLNLGVSYKFQTGVSATTDDKSWEFTGGVSRKFGKISMRVSVIYSPDDLGGARQSVYLEGGPTFEISKTTRLLATVGRRHREDGPDYTSFSAGLSKTVFRNVSVDVRWYDTNRHELGELFDGRAVISARMAF